jgi:hypothetical protein
MTAPPDRFAPFHGPLRHSKPWKIFARRGPRRGELPKTAMEEVTFVGGPADHVPIEFVILAVSVKGVKGESED